jgi:predicted Zn-dependent protease
VDTKEGKYPMMSPYNYSANNPIVNVDVDGHDYILKIYLDDKGVGHLQITYNAITTSDANKKTLEAGLALWKALNGKEIKMNNVAFKVEFTTKVETEATFEKGKEKYMASTYTNFYAGNVNVANGEPMVAKRNVSVGTVEGNSIGTSGPGYRSAETTLGGNAIHSFITTLINDFSKLSDDEKARFNDFIQSHSAEKTDDGRSPEDIAHEIGHTLGLDHNGKYDDGATINKGEAGQYVSPFDKKGVMSGSPKSKKKPTIADLKNVIIEALNKQSQAVFPAGEGANHVKLDISDEVLKKLFPEWDGKQETKATQANIEKIIIK